MKRKRRVEVCLSFDGARTDRGWPACSVSDSRKKFKLDAENSLDVLTDNFSWCNREINLFYWLRYCSWGLCQKCQGFYHRTLTPSELNNPTRCSSKLDALCWNCKHGATTFIKPRKGMYPDELFNLPVEVVRCINVIEIHQGDPKRHRCGYIRKDTLTRISWMKETVGDRIGKLPVGKRRIGELAVSWLVDNNTAYQKFLRTHNEIHRTKTCVNLPYSSLLEPYIESAIWPCLYPFKEWCESHDENLNSREPFSREKLSEAPRSYESQKAKFMAKVTSLNGQYAASYPLLQFQFDRYVFRFVIRRLECAKFKNVTNDLAFRNKHWCPSFWKRHHAVLLDVVRQYKYPQLFLTLSPWEWSFPFPVFLEEMFKELHCGPTQLPALEAITIAHALHQVVDGFLSGHSSGKAWKNHWFGNKEGGDNPVRCYFGRFEYQDGGDYHEYGKGRGSLHLHCLFWFNNFRSTGMEGLIAGDLDECDPELQKLARGVQKSKQQTRMPVHEPRSVWSWSAGTGWSLRLHVSKAFSDDMFRPFIKSLMRIFRCHQDVQWAATTSLLLRYVAGYASKFQESWDSAWLEHADTSFMAALGVARFWKAGSIEQALVLAREHLVLTNVHSTEYFPKKFNDPEDLHRRLYRERAAREESLTFLEWLRKYKVVGNEDNTVLKERTGKSVHAVAVFWKKFASDAFFWEWLQLNVPFRQITSLCHPDMWKVSPDLRCLASAISLMPATWATDAWVREFLRAQGDREDHVLTAANEVRSKVITIRQQLNGTLPIYNIVPMPPTSLRLSAEQEYILNFLSHQLDKLDEDERQSTSPTFITGSPGTGKTAVVDAFISQCNTQGHRVLRTSPTGQLVASSAKQGAVCKTISAAFHTFGENYIFNESLQDFDVWIIGEIGMVARDVADFIFSSWRRYNQQPLLVFEGDFHQLPPVSGPGDARDCVWWNHVKKFMLTQSHRCQDVGLRTFLSIIRTRKPSLVDLQILDEHVVDHTLTGEALSQAWGLLPGAVVLTFTREACEFVNACGLARTAGMEQWIPIWTDAVPSPVRWIQIKSHTRLQLTRNLNIQEQLCNGTFCDLVHASTAGLLVCLQDGRHVTIYRRAHFLPGVKQIRSAFDVCLGYACTVHKAEGQTLQSAIICLEKWSMPGWGYTAFSRVRTFAAMKIIGQPCARHFQPRL